MIQRLKLAKCKKLLRIRQYFQILKADSNQESAFFKKVLKIFDGLKKNRNFTVPNKQIRSPDQLLKWSFYTPLSLLVTKVFT